MDRQKRAVTYRRVSTKDQAKEGVSLENQTERMRAYADYKGMTIVHEIEDAGVSGGINKARQGFIELLDRVQGGDIDVIILYSLERLSRDMLTLLALERLLHEYGVQIHTIEGRDDTSTPDGFMAFAMKAFIGEMERRQVKYRTKQAMERKKANGEVYNHAPFGYTRDGGTLIPVVSEQGVIKEINRRYESGERLVDITAYLNTAGISTKKGGAWKPQQVKNLITNYDGKFKKGRRKLWIATRAFIEAIG